MNKIKLLEHPLLNLNKRVRFSNAQLVIKDNVSEHTMEVQILCKLLYDQLKEVISIDLKMLLYKAFLHDLDEALLCDIPWDIKYYSSNFREELKKITSEVLLSQLSSDFKDEIESAKDSSIEGKILQLADVLSPYRIVLLNESMVSPLYKEKFDYLKEGCRQRVLYCINQLPDECIDVLMTNFDMRV